MKALKIFLAFLIATIAGVLLYGVLLYIVIIYSGTPDTINTKLKVKNNWIKPIAVLYSTDSTKFDYGNYQYYVGVAIEPNTIESIPTRNFWEEVIDYSASKKLYFLFFDIDTIKKYHDMDYIIKDHLYIANLSYTKKELIERNWVVNFFH